MLIYYIAVNKYHISITYFKKYEIMPMKNLTKYLRIMKRLYKKELFQET